MDITLALVLAGVAVALSAFSLIRCYVPPQTRKLRDVEERVSDLEHAYDRVAQRLTKRVKDENMDKARETHLARRSAQDKVLQEAAAVIEAAKAAPPQGTLPLGDKATLRKIAGIG